MLTTLLLATATQLAPLASGLTEPPVTYVLDYGSDHVGNADWLAGVAAAPPELLHLGKDVPMTHNWGPIRALGGENQAFGKGDDVKRLSPAEVTQRINDLTAMVRSLHDAGVKMVMPYICGMTVAGHHKKRTGFWSFYDDWQKYSGPFMLGLRPAPDPAKWLQLDPQGNFQRFYKYDGDFYPAYEPNHRYAACVNNPNWQHWLTRVVKLLVRCGYDGTFVDNGASERCYCEQCQKLFRDWAKKRGLGSDDIKQAVPGGDARLYEEAQRFWMESLHQFQLRLRTAAVSAAASAGKGDKAARSFKIFPNGGHNRYEAVRLVFADSDYVMFEKSQGQFGTHPGLADGKHVNHNVTELKFVQCVRKMVKPIILTRSGYPKKQPQFEMNRASAALGCAEMAAFGNGGGFLIPPKLPDGPAVLKQWRGFYDRNADLYRSNDSFAAVGVVFWSEQKLAGNKKHAAAAEQVGSQLLAGHVPFDYVTEESFTTNNFLRRYPALVVPEISRAEPKWLGIIADWVRDGGNALLVGEHPEDSPLVALAKSRGQAKGLVMRMASLASPDAVPSWLNNYVHVNGSVFDEDERPELKNVFVNAFTRRDRATWDVRACYHIVNYNVPLGVNAPPPAPIENIMMRLPVPLDLKPRGITALDPDSPEAARPEWRAGEHSLLVKLPRLSIYKVIVVDYASTKPPPPPKPKSDRRGFDF